LETRVLAQVGGGSESSESSDEEYAFAPLFLINNRSDRALVLWCLGAFFPHFLRFKEVNLSTPRFYFILIQERATDRFSRCS
jgi:hypothetical protein